MFDFVFACVRASMRHHACTYTRLIDDNLYHSSGYIYYQQDGWENLN